MVFIVVDKSLVDLTVV